MAKTFDLELNVAEAFEDLYRPSRHKAYYGGRGSGKSHNIAEALVVNASLKPTKIVCGRQFQSSINESVKELIESKIYSLGLSTGFRILDREIRHVSTGSRFVFVGLDRNPDSQKSLEGVDIFWCEEAQTLNERSMEIIIPTIRKPGSEMWWSWNPRYKDDPIDKMFRGSIIPKNSIIKEVHYYDNPYFDSTPLKEEMERSKLVNIARYNHIWLGQYDENALAVVMRHAREGRVEVPLGVYPRYGMDFGFSTSPNAIVKLYVIEELKTIYIASEEFGHVSLRELPELIGGVPGALESTIVADSARPETIDYLSGEGISIYGAPKPQGSVKSGIEWLRGYDIVIDPSCSYMLEEKRLYRYKVNDKGKVLDVLVDDYNHGWDAVRYACHDLIGLGTNRSGGVIGGNKR